MRITLERTDDVTEIHTLKRVHITQRLKLWGRRENVKCLFSKLLPFKDKCSNNIISKCILYNYNRFSVICKYDKIIRK